MALTKCPECSGTVSDKAYFCPHCGYPLQQQTTAIPQKPQKKNRKRRANGSGTVVKLSGKRKNPFQVRVNTKLDEFGFPTYDILGNYPDRVTADIVLVEKHSMKLFYPGINGNTRHLSIPRTSVPAHNIVLLPHIKNVNHYMIFPCGTLDHKICKIFLIIMNTHTLPLNI